MLKSLTIPLTKTFYLSFSQLINQSNFPEVFADSVFAFVFFYSE